MLTTYFLKDFDDLFTSTKGAYMNNPKVEKDGKNFKIFIPAMGFTKEQIDIEIEDDILTISGKLDKENIPEILKDSEIFVKYEIKDFIVEDVKAKLENGLLTVDIISKKNEDSLNKKVLIE